MPSFDVVCKVDAQEVQNAVSNTEKEIVNRFDFKGTGTTIEWKQKESILVIESDSDGRVTAAWDALQSHLIRRTVSLKGITAGEIKTIGGGRARIDITVQQGIPQDVAKQMIKDLKDTKMKVQGSIQGDQLRVTGKKRDDLQDAIKFFKEKDYDLSLQYVNFRD